MMIEIRVLLEERSEIQSKLRGLILKSSSVLKNPTVALF